MKKTLCALLLSVAGVARAQDVPYGPVEPPPPAPEPAPVKEPVAEPKPEPPKAETPKEKKEKVEDQLPFSIGGRVVASATLVSKDDSFSVGDWQGILALKSARIEVDYRWKHILRANLEVELARGSTKVRDAWLRLDAGAVRIRAGYFKTAFSGLELTSALALPMTDRGLLNDVVVGVFRVAGRHPGVQVEWRHGAGFIDAGIWQGDTIETLGDGAGWRGAGRGGIDWKGDSGELEVGLGFEARSVRPTPFDPPEARVAVGLDGRWERRIGKDALELWAEIIAGSTEISADGDGAVFVSGRGIAAWRFGGEKRGHFYVEPYGALQLIDCDTAIRRDVVWEGAIGVNVGMWRRWRAQLGGTMRRVAAQASPVLGGDGQPLAERNALILGLGMEF